MYKNRNQTVVLLMTSFELIISNCIIYLITVIFGASLFDNFLQTCAFSCLMNVICVMPLLVQIEHKNALSLLFRVLIQQDYRNNAEFKYGTVTMYSVIGAWLGALVIPLDWDVW